MGRGLAASPPGGAVASRHPMTPGTEATCYLSLGSNLGDREGYLRAALGRLTTLDRVSVTRVSSVYETAPVGLTNQPPFLNLVLELRTSLTPRELLSACQEMENALGRTRDRRWGPRTVDLDILIYGDLTCAEGDLQLPHPRMLDRQFVLVPLAEIAPALLLADGHPAAESALPADPGVVRTGRLSLTPTAGE